VTDFKTELGRLGESKAPRIQAPHHVRKARRTLWKGAEDAPTSSA